MKENSFKSHSLDDVAKNARELSQKQDQVEVGDIVSEYAKKWMEQMEDIVQKHQTYAPKYYILQWIQKEKGHVNLLRNKCFVRRTRPDPDWNTDCYSYDNNKKELRLEWTLPPQEAARTILSHPENYDARLLDSIQTFLDGSLSKLSEENLQES